MTETARKFDGRARLRDGAHPYRQSARKAAMNNLNLGLCYGRKNELVSQSHSSVPSRTGRRPQSSFHATDASIVDVRHALPSVRYITGGPSHRRSGTTAGAPADPPEAVNSGGTGAGYRIYGYGSVFVVVTTMGGRCDGQAVAEKCSRSVEYWQGYWHCEQDIASCEEYISLKRDASQTATLSSDASNLYPNAAPNSTARARRPERGAHTHLRSRALGPTDPKSQAERTFVGLGQGRTDMRQGAPDLTVKASKLTFSDNIDLNSNLFNKRARLAKDEKQWSNVARKLRYNPVRNEHNDWREGSGKRNGGRTQDSGRSPPKQIRRTHRDDVGFAVHSYLKFEGTPGRREHRVDEFIAELLQHARQQDSNAVFNTHRINSSAPSQGQHRVHVVHMRSAAGSGCVSVHARSPLSVQVHVCNYATGRRGRGVRGGDVVFCAPGGGESENEGVGGRSYFALLSGGNEEGSHFLRGQGGPWARGRWAANLRVGGQRPDVGESVMFWLGLALKPWLWLGFVRLWLRILQAKAKATRAGLAWPGFGLSRGFRLGLFPRFRIF
ncbi:hypothetical protein C8R46DRAFT_1024382 [Mycena filopes]|nr:hypothetical protein C8R46DRAFT_1024382 [Mycena filopes]